MAADNNKKGNRIPIRFLDADRENDSPGNPTVDVDKTDPANDEEPFSDDQGSDLAPWDTPLAASLSEALESEPGVSGGPETAELVATRAELKRLEAENAELKDKLARRQADFENYRKRVDRERLETYNRVVVDIAAKLLPVLDNLKRALETEASVEATESDEFRHFLSGVDLIYKQLKGVLEALGVKPIISVGEQFDPHVHEAVVTEATNEYEPDTVMQEIVAGYRLGDNFIRPG